VQFQVREQANALVRTWGAYSPHFELSVSEVKPTSSVHPQSDHIFSQSTLKRQFGLAETDKSDRPKRL
jgi:hypothetical protein